MTHTASCRPLISAALGLVIQITSELYSARHALTEHYASWGHLSFERRRRHNQKVSFVHSCRPDFVVTRALGRREAIASVSVGLGIDKLIQLE
jgi:hypothetical protein